MMSSMIKGQLMETQFEVLTDSIHFVGTQEDELNGNVYCFIVSVKMKDGEDTIVFPLDFRTWLNKNGEQEVWLDTYLEYAYIKNGSLGIFNITSKNPEVIKVNAWISEKINDGVFANIGQQLGQFVKNSGILDTVI